MPNSNVDMTPSDPSQASLMLEQFWSELFAWTNTFDECPRVFRPPFPDNLPTPLRFACSQAFARGRQAISIKEIDGPLIPEGATVEQWECLFWYYTLALEQNALRAPAPAAPTRPETNTAPAVVEPVIRPRVPKVADPETFKGDRSKYRNYTTQLQLKFASDPTAFSTEKQKILYAGSYLRDAAYLWFQPHVQSNGNITFDTFAEFEEALCAAFADPDAYGTAERSLRALKQEGSCASYYSKFVSIAAELQWTEDKVKIHHFRYGLKEDLKDMLLGKRLSTEFSKFAEECIHLDNEMYARQQEKRKGTTNTSKGNPPKSSRTTPPAPIPASNPVSNPTPTSTPAPGGEPMELDSTQRKAYRRANNLCTYCGDSGHWVKNCPKAKNKGNRPAANQATTVPAPAPSASVLYATKNVDG